jgi:exopolyphosphatase/guanosine-5'-triphosphate,3'-diphosphate pyrophosphatase
MSFRIPRWSWDIGGGIHRGGEGCSRGKKRGLCGSVAHVDVGSVRLTERHLVSDPSTPAQRAAVVADVDRALDDAGGRLERRRLRRGSGRHGHRCGCACPRLSEYDEERVHGAVLGRADVLASCRWFAEASVSQRRQFPWLPPGRADVMGAGVLILERVLHRVPAVDTLVASEYDILDGLAWSLVE